MIITLKDGSKKEYSEAKSVIDIAYDISEGLARAACAGEVNGEVVDLRTVLDSDCELNILTAKDEKGLADLRRTCEDIRARVEQAVDNGRPALICGLVQLGHGDRVQVMRIGQPLHPAVDFVQTFRAVLKITVDFFLKSGYTVLS